MIANGVYIWLPSYTRMKTKNIWAQIQLVTTNTHIIRPVIVNTWAEVVPLHTQRQIFWQPRVYRQFQGIPLRTTTVWVRRGDHGHGTRRGVRTVVVLLTGQGWLGLTGQVTQNQVHRAYWVKNRHPWISKAFHNKRPIHFVVFYIFCKHNVYLQIHIECKMHIVYLELQLIWESLFHKLLNRR